MASLEDQLAAENAASWAPNKEPGHDRVLTGTLLMRGVFRGDYGDSPILTIDRGGDSPDANPPGRFAGWFAFGAVAESEVQEKNPQPGERVAVLYKGTDTVKSGANAGKPYPVFKVFVERDGDVPPVSAPAPVESDVPIAPVDDARPTLADDSNIEDDVPFRCEPDRDWTDRKSHANR